jgi:hypothetical protein
MWEKILIKILPQLLSGASPVIREAICTFSGQLIESAKQTENPLDDILASFVNSLFCD